MGSSSTIGRMGGDTSIWIVLLTVLGVLASVWFVVRLSDDPGEIRRLPDEARLAGFVLVPPAGSPWLGVNIATAEELVRPRGVPVEGVVVGQVMVGSPAHNAGLMRGDVIERVASNPVRAPGDLVNALARAKPGDTVPITISRNGTRMKIHVTLAAQPMGKLAAATATAGPAWFGADVQNIDKLLAERLGLPDRQGVIVSYVFPGSPAKGAGLAQGDVIKRVGEVRVRDIDQVSGLLAAKLPGDPLRLTVWHRGAQRDLNIRLAAPPSPEKVPPPTLPEAVVEIEAAWLGLDIVPLDPAEAEELGLSMKTRGMVVDAVAAGRGVDAGLQVGDLIVAVNGKPTPTVKAFKKASEDAVGALVDVIRFGRHIYVSVPPPSVEGGANGGSAIRQVGFFSW